MGPQEAPYSPPKAVRSEPVEDIRRAVEWMQRGRYTIQECERVIDTIIHDATHEIKDLDERLAAEKKLKRTAWRRLLEATKK